MGMEERREGRTDEREKREKNKTGGLKRERLK